MKIYKRNNIVLALLFMLSISSMRGMNEDNTLSTDTNIQDTNLLNEDQISEITYEEEEEEEATKYKKRMQHLTISQGTNNDSGLEYWKQKLQMHLNKKDNNNDALVKNYFNDNKNLLDQELFFLDGEEDAFTPFCLTLLTDNENLTKWFEEQESQNICTPQFLQYAMQHEEMHDIIVDFFKTNPELLNKKQYKKNYQEVTFTPLQLAFITPNAQDLYETLMNMGAQQDDFVSYEFLQYLIQANTSTINKFLINYFRNNKNIINEKKYHRNNNQKKLERRSKKPSPTHILYTPLRLALLLHNHTVAYNLVLMGAKCSNIYDKQKLVQLLIEADNDFAKTPFKNLLKDTAFIKQTMRYIEIPLTPLQYAQGMKSEKSYNAISKSLE